MRRRIFLAAASTLVLGSFSFTGTALARDDDNSGSDGSGRGRGRGRGRGGDDGPDDRGGGSSSGHRSEEERAVSIGDSRADRAESRLREDLKEDAIRDRDLLRRGGDERGQRGRDALQTGGGQAARIEQANSQDPTDGRGGDDQRSDSSSGLGRFLAELFGGPRER